MNYVRRSAERLLRSLSSSVPWMVCALAALGSAASLRGASKQPEFTPMPELVSPVTPEPGKAPTEEPAVIVTNLQGIVIYGKLEDVKGGGIEGGVKGVDLHSAPTWLQRKSFGQLLG